MNEWEVDGPQWCMPGLDVRGGRYPLAVEAPVLRMVDRLVPGVSTLTELSRYYSLYWALAEHSDQNDLDVTDCKTLLRRAEVGLALTSMWDPDSTALVSGRSNMHGVSRIASNMGKGLDGLPGEGPSSYSPRAWGFWSQYSGPSVVLGSVALQDRALRRGSVKCPAPVSELFGPLVHVCSQRPVEKDDLSGLPNLGAMDSASPDFDPLRRLLVGEPDLRTELSGTGRTRRTAFQLIARSAQLSGGRPTSSWSTLVRDVVVYGSHLDCDPFLSAGDANDKFLAWRGTLLRRSSVGAWRWLWSALVSHVHEAASPLPVHDLYEWIRESVDEIPLERFLKSLPATRDSSGYLAPAEQQISTLLHDGQGVQWAIATLLLGAQRKDELDDRVALEAFRGGSRRGDREFLSPSWVAGRRDDLRGVSLRDFACALVDDMLAQSRRVALRKMIVEAGHLVVFSKLHEREGFYFATGTEGSGNVGLRLEQLGGIAEQLGLVSVSDNGVRAVTDLGRESLRLPT